MLSFSQQGQDLFLDKVIFKSSVREGFFIEAGAWDGEESKIIKAIHSPSSGETLSNSLLFELEHG